MLDALHVLEVLIAVESTNNVLDVKMIWCLSGLQG